MKVAKRIGMWLLVACMLVSSLSFTVAFADDSASTGTDFTQESGTYTADITQNADGNWHIVKWLTDKAVCKRDSADYKKDGTLYNFMQTKENETAGVPFAYVTGGVPEGSFITEFTIDASSVNNSAFLEVYGAKTLAETDSEWTKLNASSSKSNGKEGNLNKTITYTMSAAESYRYIKVVNTSTSKDVYYYRLGGFSFKWAKNPLEITGASGTYTTDITLNADGNWRILKWLTDKPVCKRDSNDYQSADGTLYNFMQTKETETAGVPFEYVTGGVPEGSFITEFTIDVGDKYSQYLKVYGAKSIDGEWTELAEAAHGMNDDVADKGSLKMRVAYRPTAAEGYRYIRVANTSTNKSESYLYRLGGFSFKWDAVASATVTYNYNDATKKLNATVNFVNQPEISPFIVLAGYKGDALNGVSYKEVDTFSGNKTLEYEIDASDITSARLYLWDAETYAPIETFESYTKKTLIL